MDTITDWRRLRLVLHRGSIRGLKCIDHWTCRGNHLLHDQRAATDQFVAEVHGPYYGQRKPDYQCSGYTIRVHR